MFIQQKAFKELKNKLIVASILAYLDFTKLFILFKDISDIALESILSQFDIENKEKIDKKIQ
ncbi:10213_t:CDS:2 [Dentiscutata erythropus]|uniref:10213_t:CDS:1 n=1 Tax=Dentiscutata erythropus TaxID=1348616 RepID=A0A9N9D6G0_9GLOM|nr:10213_t:CDS:2 [Dentiscutata erythropus]